MLCCLPVVYVLGGVLVREGNKNRQFFTGTYVQSKASCREPGKSSYTLPAEKTLSACHASYSARMELKPPPTCPDGLPVSAYVTFCRKVLVQRDMLEEDEKITIVHIYKVPLREVAMGVAQERNEKHPA